MGLPEPELHLFEHQERHLEYLRQLEARTSHASQRWSPNFPEMFASPAGDGDYPFSISNDMITEVYAEFSTRTRKNECTAYLQTLTGAIFCHVSALITHSRC